MSPGWWALFTLLVGYLAGFYAGRFHARHDSRSGR
jgi:hypothetical protein